jgi:hypothetical protein
MTSYMISSKGAPLLLIMLRGGARQCTPTFVRLYISGSMVRAG